MSTDVAHALGSNEALEEFDCGSGKAGNIERYLFEGEKRAFASAVADGVRDFGACAGSCADLVNRVATHEVADVGDDPLRAGFDEGIVVKLLDVFFENGCLLGNDGTKREQRLAVLGIAYAIDGRQE